MEDYALLDAGDGRRLERFAEVVVDRPAPGATAVRRDPAAWPAADLRYDRDGGWTGPAVGRAGDGAWTAHLAGVTLRLHPTDTGQVGCYPEHATGLPWLEERVRRRRQDRPVARPVRVLHLFAATGLATIALARAGAEVVHIDAARPTVAWARENAAANGLTDAPIRWIVDDALAFLAREARRERRYDGVVLDPPSYGHGGPGRAWRIGRDLPALLVAVGAVLAADGFVLLSAHTPALGADRLREALGPLSAGARVERADLVLRARSGASLALGAVARLDRAS